MASDLQCSLKPGRVLVGAWQPRAGGRASLVSVPQAFPGVSLLVTSEPPSRARAAWALATALCVPRGRPVGPRLTGWGQVSWTSCALSSRPPVSPGLGRWRGGLRGDLWALTCSLVRAPVTKCGSGQGSHSLCWTAADPTMARRAWGQGPGWRGSRGVPTPVRSRCWCGAAVGSEASACLAVRRYPAAAAPLRLAGTSASPGTCLEAAADPVGAAGRRRSGRGGQAPALPGQGLRGPSSPWVRRPAAP